MIPDAPENKSVKGPLATRIVPLRPVPTPAELARLQAELDAEAMPVVPPAGPRRIGQGSCPRCGAEGPIYVDDSGPTRRIVHGGCVCRRKAGTR